MAGRLATPSGKKHGRKRRMAGWLLVVIGVLITGVWGASRWWTFGFGGSNWSTSLAGGKLRVYVYPSDIFSSRWAEVTGPIDQWNWAVSGQEWQRARVQISVDSWIVLYAQTSGPVSKPIAPRRAVLLVPWPFALSSFLGAGWFLWSGRSARRRAMAGVCLKCGYDLTGLQAATGASCPECGAATPPREP